MDRYHKLAELAPRDIVSRAIFAEEQNGQVYLDIRHKKPEYIKTRFPKIYQTLKSYGIDMAKDLVPISPAAHYQCGGVSVNLRGETGIKNLYAFGEVTGTGVHGANRLASNSLLEALVFSDRILRNDTKRGDKTPPRFKAERYIPLGKKEMKKIRELRKQLRHVMWTDVGIVRSKESLTAAVSAIAKLQKEADKIHDNAKEALEVKNMIVAGSLITKAALARKKSIGCHYRIS